MGLHSSAGKVLQRERRGHGLEFLVEAPKILFRANCLNCGYICDGHIFISFVRLKALTKGIPNSNNVVIQNWRMKKTKQELA